MSYEKQAMTAFAQAALAARDLVTAKFASTRFSGSPIRTVFVEAPQVESTGGGKQARESIILRPEGGDTAGSVTCGFLDVGVRSCELRSYASLNMLHRQRYSVALDLHQSEYDKFLDELRGLLEQEGFVIKIVEPAEQQAKAQATTGGGGGGGASTAVMAGIGVVAALVVVALLAMLFG